MNTLILHGNLAKDPEKRSSQNGTSIVSITVAVKHGYGDNQTTEFIPATAFGKTADFIEKYFSKGSEIVMTGEVLNNNYERQDGTKVYGLKIVVNAVEFAGTKKKTSDDKASLLEGFDEVEDINLPF